MDATQNRLGPGARRWLIAVLVVGAAVRLFLAIALTHRSYDLQSFRMVADALRERPLHVYRTLRWPYPPGFFPFVLAARILTGRTGIDMSIWIKMPSIVADLLLAWLAQAFLGLRNVGDRERVSAAALVAVGPSFFVVSGYDGQIDAVAVLPAIIALYLWMKWPAGDKREIAAALLVGLGGGLKTIPLLFVLAFLPVISPWGRRIRFAVVASAVPIAMLLPWAIADPASLRILKYSGFPGAGGLSLAIQPRLPFAFLTEGAGVVFSHGTTVLREIGAPLLLVAVATTTVVLFVKPRRPERAAVVIWLCVYVFLPSFFFQYAIWGLATFVIAGYLSHAAVAQSALLVPMLIWEGRPWVSRSIVLVYAVAMLAVWGGTIVAFVREFISDRRSLPQFVNGRATEPMGTDHDRE
jgi:hypothetical protein